GQIEQLQRQINPDKPAPPGACKLSGAVAGDVVHLRAEFEFETDKPKAKIALGCQKAWPTGAKLDDDGRLPLLSALGEEGLVVQVETPGKHKLILDMDVPVVSPEGRGTDRGFELGLPQAAITLLEQLDLSDQVAEFRVAGRTASIPAKWLNSKSANRQ